MVFIITQATVLPVMETLPLWADTVLENEAVGGSRPCNLC